MKSRIISFILALTVCTSAVSLAGCGNKEKNDDVALKSESTAQSSQAEETNKYDPFGKYDKPVTITAVGTIGASASDKIPKDTTHENQAFVKVAKEKLNIDIKFLWIAPENQYEQKFGVAMASGELPDVMSLNSNHFENLKDNDQLADLTEAYKYAGGNFKAWVERDVNMLEVGKIDGKLYSIPRYTDTRRELNMLSIRKDWLVNLGMEVPKTMEELKKVAKAFADNDPDKNGKKDTVGLGVDQKVMNWGFDIRGIMNSFGAYPSAWIKDESGNLVAGEIQPNVKKALEFLQVMYKEGGIDKEFAMKSVDKVAEDVTAGKVGMVYGPWWLYEWPFNLSKDKTPNVEWISTAIPSADENPAKALIPRVAINDYKVVNKECKNPEAVIKLYNLWCDFDGNEEKYGKAALYEGGNVWKWVPTTYFDPFDINTLYEKINNAIDTNDDKLVGWSMAEKERLKSHKEYTEYLKGNGKWDSDRFGGVMARSLKDTGGWAITRKIVESGNIMYNEFYGLATENQKDKGASLEKMTDEAFAKIIMGAPISGFDKYVENWKNLGGDQITKEVNEWYAKNKK